jgi:hypothetical protein
MVIFHNMDGGGNPGTRLLKATAFLGISFYLNDSNFKIGSFSLVS